MSITNVGFPNRQPIIIIIYTEYIMICAGLSKRLFEAMNPTVHKFTHILAKAASVDVNQSIIYSILCSGIYITFQQS